MADKAQTALLASIEHWKANRSAETPYDAGVSGSDCALCVEFTSGDSEPCKGCPIREKTGYRGCKESPYVPAIKAYGAWRADPTNPEKQLAWTEACTAMIVFMEGLLK